MESCTKELFGAFQKPKCLGKNSPPPKSGNTFYWIFIDSSIRGAQKQARAADVLVDLSTHLKE